VPLKRPQSVSTHKCDFIKAVSATTVADVRATPNYQNCFQRLAALFALTNSCELKLRGETPDVGVLVTCLLTEQKHFRGRNNATAAVAS